MMLSKLQPKQSSNPDSHCDTFVSRLEPKFRREVRISDAMAHLAIINNEVIALATEYSEDEMTVMACTSTPEDPPELAKQPESMSYVDQIKSYLFMKNPRRDDPPTDPVVTHPTIISAMPPEDMGSQTLPEYIRKLNGSSCQ
jgi:hypothetical protein